MTILPSYLSKAPPVMHLTFSLESVLVWMGLFIFTAFPVGML